MARKLYFEWTLTERVENLEEINDIRINKQFEKLNVMLEDLQSKIQDQLVGVKIDRYYLVKANGIYEDKEGYNKEYIVSNKMNIIISKTGRKTTWNDVYGVINTIKATQYDLR